MKEKIIFDGSGPFVMDAEPAKIHFTNYFTPSGWRCELFGADNSMVLHPREGQVPNAFWRWMQYICFGNKWIKEEKK